MVHSYIMYIMYIHAHTFYHHVTLDVIGELNNFTIDSTMFIIGLCKLLQSIDVVMIKPIVAHSLSSSCSRCHWGNLHLKQVTEHCLSLYYMSSFKQ